jgi:aminoglycoside phosphotransferase (APT) family kinase protein
MLRRLANMNIPDTLCHLDCNPGNVVVSSAKCTFLDWCEAAVGNPILNFQLFLDYFRFCFASGAQAESALISAYVRSWEGLLEPHVVRNALQLAPALAVFTTAVSFVVRRDRKDMASPQTSAWLRSLARRMHREVEAASALQFVA